MARFVWQWISSEILKASLFMPRMDTYLHRYARWPGGWEVAQWGGEWKCNWLAVLAIKEETKQRQQGKQGRSPDAKSWALYRHPWTVLQSAILSCIWLWGLGYCLKSGAKVQQVVRAPLSLSALTWKWIGFYWVNSVGSYSVQEDTILKAVC